ncbi:hypothetical protein DRW03_18620 [Corallococcus sp. H22C18031201]|uniref:YXWGXW repeat-containing protein n=1 Tax=Citreicoccus inhibens TaxID=2849499 RepID=UPI000E766B5A|nr:YXWGXW repeat-containing protein [Citreicoccus inhibens]MBU8900099.1 YXWGXW repeat-containing protein [Citreicoccus inhibens]RJS20697.1 hypothetical protein DRW03_18620 [Corallococcus sp. H22C18031201]
MASSRWWVCLAVGLATQGAFAQTAPVAAMEPASESYGDSDMDDDSGPVAPSPPPQLPAENPTARPDSDSVWASGFWFWDGGQWVFKSGGWVERMPGYQFVNGYWAQDGDVWRWVSGGWARPGSTDVEIPIAVDNEEVTTAQAPPPLRQEVRPQPPAPEYVWAPGYWYWGVGGWDWVTGGWIVPPRAGLAFVSPRWVRRGPSWVFVGGGWASRGTLSVSIPVYRHASIAVTLGRPNVFLRSWYRYPMVSWRHVPEPRYRYHDGRWTHYESRVRAPPPSHYHSASPGPRSGGHGGGRGGHRH